MMISGRLHYWSEMRFDNLGTKGSKEAQKMDFAMR